MRARFTLVEMMIVVAIMMVLAAIALPQLNEFQLRAKDAEVSTNLTGIMDAQVAYSAATDGYPGSAGSNPAGTAGKTPRTWTTGTVFDTIAWAPDGAVRATYYVGTYKNTVANCNGAAAMVNCYATSPAYPCAGGKIDADADAVANCAYVSDYGNSMAWVYGTNVH